MKKIYLFLLCLFSTTVLNAQQLVADIFNPGSSNPSNFTEYNGKLYFSVLNPNDSKYYLYRFDPNDNSTTLAEGQNTPFDEQLSKGIVFQNKLYFAASARNETNKSELYEYNAATQTLVEITNGLPNSTHQIIPTNFIVAAGKLYFSGETNTSVSGQIRRKLISYDGNTMQEISINNQYTGNVSNMIVDNIIQIDGILYFRSNSSPTTSVFYYNPSTSNSGILVTTIESPSRLLAYGTDIFLRGRTLSGLDRLFKIEPFNSNQVTTLSLNASQLPLTNMVGHANKLYYKANQFGDTSALGIYDIINNSFDYKSTATTSNVGYITKYDGKIYFKAGFPGPGQELGIYDPITDVIQLAADINTTSSGGGTTLSGNPEWLHVFHGELYFGANNGATGQELFKFNASQLSNESFNDIDAFSIYPNPVENSFTINSNSQIQSLEIFDLQGKKIKTFTNEINFDISNLNSGIYIGKIETENNINKFIKIIKK